MRVLLGVPMIRSQVRVWAIIWVCDRASTLQEHHSGKHWTRDRGLHTRTLLVPLNMGIWFLTFNLG